jgi:uncharacterized protein (DUF1684 family)
VVAVDELDLADWRERVARLYLSDVDLAGFRSVRDDLFRDHPQSPIPPEGRAGFAGLPHFRENPDAVVEAEIRPVEGSLDIDTGGDDGVVHYRRVGIVNTPYGELSLWWIEAYGGGLFLPVRDGTSGQETYGGGRYLTDTVKGTFGRGLVVLGRERVRLDFNYLYNPSCVYNYAYACPLAPPENWVSPPIRAGELDYASRGQH